jgi:hypothetical protein
MFLAHYAVGLAAKRLAPQVSLGTLFLAAQFADLLWPILVMLGVEAFAVAPGNTTFTPLAFTHYPYSHSLLALAGWGVSFATAHGLEAVTWSAQALWLVVAWGYWIDRHRALR